MRCTSCHRNIAAGVEAQKMIVEYRQPSGELRLHGYMMSDGPVSAATGAMVRGWHHKCYWVAKKREAKGNAVTGRVIAGAPTGYDINEFVLTRDDLDALGITPAQARERSTVVLSARVGLLREVAQRIGKGVGDPQVQEAFLASEHGGPYLHHHEHRLDTYQLIAHLKYAHGLDDPKLLAHPHDTHEWHHALRAQTGVTRRRHDDDEPELRESDWRDQYTTELP